MEPILDIPAPEAGDSETVASSLETAAIFGAKGDGAEALRWLQRAAESAGEGGDDARMLALARTVASLSSRLNGTPELEGRRPPSPPARPAEPPPDEAEEKPFLLESRSRPPPPSSRPTGTPPPPPSSRARGSSPVTAHEPVAPSAASKSGAGRRARQAARVSITRSLTERGLYFVRVLDEGQGVASDAFEGILVSNDPNQSLV